MLLHVHIIPVYFHIHILYINIHIKYDLYTYTPTVLLLLLPLVSRVLYTGAMGATKIQYTYNTTRRRFRRRIPAENSCIVVVLVGLKIGLSRYLLFFSSKIGFKIGPGRLPPGSNNWAYGGVMAAAAASVKVGGYECVCVCVHRTVVKKQHTYTYYIILYTGTRVV